MGIPKAKEIEIAKKKRARLLAEFRRLGWTVTAFAVRHGVSTSRMSSILRVAKHEMPNARKEAAHGSTT